MASSSRSGRETKSAAFLFAPGVKVGGGGGGETRRGTTKTPRRWRMPFEEKGKGHLDDGAHYGGKKNEESSVEEGGGGGGWMPRLTPRAR